MLPHINPLNPPLPYLWQQWHSSGDSIICFGKRVSKKVFRNASSFTCPQNQWEPSWYPRHRQATCNPLKKFLLLANSWRTEKSAGEVNRSLPLSPTGEKQRGDLLNLRCENALLDCCFLKGTTAQENIFPTAAWPLPCCLHWRGGALSLVYLLVKNWRSLWQKNTLKLQGVSTKESALSVAPASGSSGTPHLPECQMRGAARRCCCLRESFKWCS